MWGMLTVSRLHWVCPCSRCVCFPVVPIVQAPGCSAGELSKVGPGLCALPRCKLLRFRFSGTLQRHRLSWAYVLCPSKVRAAQVTRCLASALSLGGGGASYSLPRPSCLVSWVCHGRSASGVQCVSSGELISGCNPPSGCQPSRIPGSLG